MTKGTAPVQANALPDPIDNTELVEAFRCSGGRLFHVLPTGKLRGMTFAYRVKGSRIEFATSVQHRNDTFTKKMGTKTAIEHFQAGNTVHFPLGKNRVPTECLLYMARVIR